MADVFDDDEGESSCLSFVWLLDVWSFIDFGVNVESVSSILTDDEISSINLIDGDVCSFVRWHENNFNSWLRTGRTTLTVSGENNDRRMLFTIGTGGIRVDLISLFGGDDIWVWVLSICFSAIKASKSDTRGVVEFVRGERIFECVILGMFFDLLTTVCAGRERVTERVTDRNGSGDFDTVELKRGDLLFVVVNWGERNGVRGERDWIVDNDDGGGGAGGRECRIGGVFGI